MAKLQSVGELNGRWAHLFKLAMVLIPFVFLFQAWLVTQVFALQKFQTEIETINPGRISERVADLELEAARHGWDGDE